MERLPPLASIDFGRLGIPPTDSDEEMSLSERKIAFTTVFEGAGCLLRKLVDVCSEGSEGRREMFGDSFFDDANKLRALGVKLVRIFVELEEGTFETQRTLARVSFRRFARRALMDSRTLRLCSDSCVDIIGCLVPPLGEGNCRGFV
mmetsp:Transcript_9172/g.21440  ORF Transcript_9172/g.21440 Transcript_9172/m.21440 type:complete len:147 (-) Transcript_9172:1748-2188(-)